MSESHRRISKAIVLGLLIAVVPFFLRTHTISRDFWLMYDQIRDWDLVQTSFGSLPVTGTPRSGGGYHIGPAYYHFLWLSRVTLNSLLGNLPHVGGITVTFLDVVSTFALGLAAWRIGVPFGAVLGLSLLLVTNPYGAALARAGWNPSLSLAFSNLGLALYLVGHGRWTVGCQLLLTALCWMAVEMHTAAFPLTLTLVTLAIVFAPGYGACGRLGLAATSALVIVACQLPPLVMGLPDDAAAESSLSLSLSRFFGDPWVALSGRGLRFVIGEGAEQLFLTSGLPVTAGVAILCAAIGIGIWAGLVRLIEPAIALAAYGPLAIGAAAFTIFDRELEAYWLIPVLGVYYLVVSLPFTLLRTRPWGLIAGAACVVAVLSTLPLRWTHFRMDHRYPLYATVVGAASELAQQGTVVRAFVGPADGIRPTTSSPLVRWQGGTLSPSSPLEARVSRSGHIELVPVASTSD